jgi:hypothetical protein
MRKKAVTIWNCDTSRFESYFRKALQKRSPNRPPAPLLLMLRPIGLALRGSALPLKQETFA